MLVFISEPYTKLKAGSRLREALLRKVLLGSSTSLNAFKCRVPFQYKDNLPDAGIPIIKIRWSRERLICITVISVLASRRLIIETACSMILLLSTIFNYISMTTRHNSKWSTRSRLIAAFLECSHRNQTSSALGQYPLPEINLKRRMIWMVHVLGKIHLNLAAPRFLPRIFLFYFLFWQLWHCQNVYYFGSML